MSFRLSTIAAALVAASAAVSPAAAVTFDFSFSAPFDNGDTGSGSGHVTTGDADGNGRYEVLAASGKFFSYQGVPEPSAITGAGGSLFTSDPAYLYKDGDGAWVTDGIAFFADDRFISFFDRAGSVYRAFSIEVGSKNASLGFAPVSAGAVPEPATWGLMALGFGLVGAAARGRRRGIAAA